MRVLSLWQPWAILTVAPDSTHPDRRPPKGIETRHWVPQLELPIPVAIHATKKRDGDVQHALRDPRFARALARCGFDCGFPSIVERFVTPYHDTTRLRPLEYGVIVGTAIISQVLTSHDIERRGPELVSGEGRWSDEEYFGNYGFGRYGFVLSNPWMLPRPIAFSGRQEVLYDLPREVDDEIRQQWGEVQAA